MAFVKKSNNNFIVNAADGELHSFSTEKFKDNWSGVVLAAENQLNEVKPKKKVNFTILSIIFIFLSICTTSIFSIFLAVFLFLILFGLFFSIESVKQNWNIKSDFSSKFCNITTETDCNTVINSKSFQLFNTLSLSDVSIVFFSGQLISLLSFLLLGLEKDYHILSLTILYLSLPISIASIYYQWRVAKKWCVICLGIIAILIIEFLLCQFFPKEIDLLNFNYLNQFALLFLFPFIISLTGWLFLKPLLTSYFHVKDKYRELYKFKKNYNLFKSALLSERKVAHQNLQSDLFIGNKNAKLTITIVTNPLCKYCKDTQLLVNELIKKYKDEIRINIFFNYKLNKEVLEENNEITKLHTKLVDLYLNKGQTVFLEALSSWFLSKNYDQWFGIYGEILEKKEDSIKLLKKQDQFNTNNNILFTPTLFIGSFFYPALYNKEDILFFINELLEDYEILIKI